MLPSSLTGVKQEFKVAKKRQIHFTLESEFACY